LTFLQGNRTIGDRGHDYPISPKPQGEFHNYTIDWTKDRIQWILDGTILRNQTFDQALGGKNYPQTPMNVRLGAWAAGDASKNDVGTVEWAGGHTDFKDGPFIMAVQSVYAKDYTTAKEYSWDGMDASGDWQKVKVITLVFPIPKQVPY
jgi:beta-glucanase (GH16 family)